jgi:hypothetical protein
MLSPAEVARIKKDVSRLEKDLDAYTDSGLRKVIQNWLGEARKKLVEAKKRSLRVSFSIPTGAMFIRHRQVSRDMQHCR